MMPLLTVNRSGSGSGANISTRMPAGVPAEARRRAPASDRNRMVHIVGGTGGRPGRSDPAAPTVPGAGIQGSGAAGHGVGGDDVGQFGRSQGGRAEHGGTAVVRGRLISTVRFEPFDQII
ncbi:hypothetical protein A6A07_15695 [Streptomyces sp. CB03911]|nr:hypothetical protein A6A07_15695 [Streptomyces sp. CB03911]